MFEITDMYSPCPNRIRLNEVYEADGSHSELEFSFNGVGFNLVNAELHHDPQ